MPRGRPFDHIAPEHLVTLENVRIHALRYDERREPYFEVDSGGETFRVRVNHKSTDIIEWIESHLDIPLDLTIFPYQWKTSRRSGVINYFKHAQVRGEA